MHHPPSSPLGIRVVWWHPPEQPDASTLGRLAPHLPTAEATRLAEPMDERVRISSARAWAMATVVLRHHGADVPAPQHLGRNDDGRPQFYGGPPGWDLSMAHGGGIICVALAHNGRVGVDVEGPRIIRAETVRRVCHPNELAVWHAAPPAQQAAIFLRLWTLKEAYLKALGVGLGQDPAGVEVVPAQREGAGTAAVATQPAAQLQHVPLTNGRHLAWCVLPPTT